MAARAPSAPADPGMNRREFLRRLFRAALTAGMSGGAFWDSPQPIAAR